MMMNKNETAISSQCVMDPTVFEECPPLESIDITTETDDSVSSLSSNDEEDIDDDCLPQDEQADNKPRSIFKNYWNNDGSAPSIKRAPSPRCVRSPLDLLEKEDSDSNITYERSLKQVEVAPISRTYGTNQLVPKWWGGLFTASAPSLMQPRITGVYTRNGKSEPALHQGRPKRSALRKGRFSPEGSEKCNCNCHPAVTFNAKIEVMRYEPPKETWAPEGWSSWFTYKGA